MKKIKSNANIKIMTEEQNSNSILLTISLFDDHFNNICKHLYLINQRIKKSILTLKFTAIIMEE